ncbi:RNA-binding domain-containing protein [Sistotremastrum niveocremeum HHB9708]|uniref:RNA-binding domain-containing protein n=1 Tax=Sistotremastrum niveocremeum HHB9708 TaxID=1314777 RepID=A0A164VLU3_9AGAM|nr:RNA-binding domain-containing protein [Sistotremastrum niveocremeum HHB9708]
MSVTVAKSSSASILKTTGLKSDVTVKKVKSQSKTKVVAAEDVTEAPPTKKAKSVKSAAPKKDSGKDLKAATKPMSRSKASKEDEDSSAEGSEEEAPGPSKKPSKKQNAGKKGKAAEAVEEEEIHLAGFSSDGSDSSDEEDGAEVDEIPGVDIMKLPTVAKDDVSVQRRLAQAKKQPTAHRGVLYVGRIPHGFYEDQMKGYFSQFGDVTRVRLSRSKKSGKSKHYGFIEFESSSVATIVQETMDNYLLMGHILRCKLIPTEQVHPELWVGANRKWRLVPRDRIARVEQNAPRTEEQQQRAEKKLLKRQEQKKRKLAEAGIDYDMSGAEYKNRRTEA